MIGRVALGLMAACLMAPAGGSAAPLLVPDPIEGSGGLELVGASVDLRPDAVVSVTLPTNGIARWSRLADAGRLDVSFYPPAADLSCDASSARAGVTLSGAPVVGGSGEAAEDATVDLPLNADPLGLSTVAPEGAAWTVTVPWFSLGEPQRFCVEAVLVAPQPNGTLLTDRVEALNSPFDASAAASWRPLPDLRSQAVSLVGSVGIDGFAIRVVRQPRATLNGRPLLKARGLWQSPPAGARLGVGQTVTVGVAVPRSCSPAGARAALADNGGWTSIDRSLRSWLAGGESASSDLFSIESVRCRDLTGDDVPEMLVSLGCCTGSSPAPFVIFRATDAGWLQAFTRAYDLWGAPRLLPGRGRSSGVTFERPVYGGASTCCAPKVRVYRTVWTGKRFQQRYVGVRWLSRPKPRAVSPASPARPSPAPRPQPAPRPGRSYDYNCDDFPLSDGTTAQEYLAMYPDDPSRLDGNRDGLACER